MILNAENTLADGSSIVLNSANQKNYDDVNLYINANNTINGNVTGLGYIYNGTQSASANATVTLTGDNSGFTGTYYQNKGNGKLVIAENSKSPAIQSRSHFAFAVCPWYSKRRDQPMRGNEKRQRYCGTHAATVRSVGKI